MLLKKLTSERGLQLFHSKVHYGGFFISISFLSKYSQVNFSRRLLLLSYIEVDHLITNSKSISERVSFGSGGLKLKKTSCA